MSTLSRRIFTGQSLPAELSSDHPSKDKELYESYLSSCEDYVITQDAERKQCDDLRGQIGELNLQIQNLQLENASLTSTDEQTETHVANKELQEKTLQLVNLQRDNEELNKNNADLEQSLNELKCTSEEDGGAQVADLKRQLEELKTINEVLQKESTGSKQHSITESAITNEEEDGTALREEIQDLTEQNNDLQTYNAAYQREVEQLKQHLEEVTKSTTASQTELQTNLTNLTQQLQQYQTYSTNLQSENDHLKRLSQAAMMQGSDQEVSIRAELQNQVNVLKHENQHYQSEYENLRQGWMKYQQESSTYTESIQQQYQHLQGEYQQLQNQQQTMKQSQSAATIDESFNTSKSVTSIGSGNQLQEKMHNLSLMLTEKAEECVRLQHDNDTIKSKMVEMENDNSDMELIREECKQLKAMLMSNDHEETISNLQSENKQLKQQLDQIQKLDVEKDNDLSDMELVREECRQLKLMLVNKDSPAEFEHLTEQKSQLEQSLRTKDEELQLKNASLVEMQNSISDMELVQEECRQLKLMLMNNSTSQPPQDQSLYTLEAKLQMKDEELRKKDSIILEMQNTSSDVDLLREQCEQLKTMLSEKENGGSFNDSSSQNNTTMDNSFMVQVQQLEEIMKEKDQQLQQRDNFITELQNTASDMDLLHSECRALKEIISEKEKTFAELQNDLDLANNVLEQRHSEISVKTTENQLLREQMLELNETVVIKENELNNMKEEMQEAVLQDENIHLLQTEYRNVEEQLKTKENELSEIQQRLFNAETHCERLKVYEEQYEGLKNTLKVKESELNTLQLQSSDSSILESESVTLLQQELNQLKSIVYEKEGELGQANKALEETKLELQNLTVNYRQIQEAMALEQSKVMELEQQLHDQLEREPLARNPRNENEDEESNSQTESQLMYFKSAVTELTNQNQELGQHLQTSKQTVTELTERLETLTSEKGLLEEERKIAVDNLQNQTLQLKQLEGMVQKSEQNQKDLLEKLTAKSDESQSIESLQHEKQAASIYISNLRSLLRLTEQSDDASLGNALSEIVQTVQILLNTLEQRDTLIRQIYADHQTQIEAFQQKLSELEQLKDISDFKITDLQSQLLEYGELANMYQKKCSEYDTLLAASHDNEKRKDELLHLQSVYQEKCVECEQLQAGVQHQSDNQQKALQNDDESERLREELTKNSHSLLDKNKECDKLKLDILQLEEKVFNLEKATEESCSVEDMRNQVVELTSACQQKELDNERLQSQLEDTHAVLESGKKEKVFLDQLVKEKNAMATEKEEIAFQNNQLSNRMQELEIELKHKDTETKEVEAKTKRELERLRNHLMMV